MKNETTTSEPTIGMNEFFALAEVKAMQAKQERNHPKSDAWKAAHEEMVKLATNYGAQRFFR